MQTVLKTFRRHPWQAATIVLATIVLFPAFYWVVSFLVAVTPAEAVARGGPGMPSDWEAGVLNHGSYYEWYTISGHPFLFGISVFFLVVALVLQAVCFIRLFGLFPFGPRRSEAHLR